MLILTISATVPALREKTAYGRHIPNSEVHLMANLQGVSMLFLTGSTGNINWMRRGKQEEGKSIADKPSKVCVHDLAPSNASVYLTDHRKKRMLETSLTICASMGPLLQT